MHFKGWGGVGHVNVPCKWHATQLKGWVGVGWGGACINVHVNLAEKENASLWLPVGEYMHGWAGVGWGMY